MGELLRGELDAVTGAGRGDGVGPLLEHAALAEKLRAWVRRALADAHLVGVASTLQRRCKAELDQLRDLGVPVDLLGFFPDWRHGSRRGFRPKVERLRPPPSGAGQPIESLRVQLSPASGTIPYALMLLRDLIRRLESTVSVTVVVEPGANLSGMMRTIATFGRNVPKRVRLVELPCVTVFARDSARSARDADGNPVLVVPRAFRSEDFRLEDGLEPARAERALGLPVRRSLLYWEGGNLLHDGERTFIGVDTIAENQKRLGLTRKEVLAIFGAEHGTDVASLGDGSRARFDVSRAAMAESGQASFHIDLDVALLGRFGRLKKARALMADPDRGLDLLPAVLERRALVSGHFLSGREVRSLLEAEYDGHARERHERLLGYCDALEKLGYRVFGVPDLRVDPRENVFQTENVDFGYCNVLPGRNRGGPAVHFLAWGIPALDRAAEECYRKAGVAPVRISRSGRVANALMKLGGGLRCFCGALT